MKSLLTLLSGAAISLGLLTACETTTQDIGSSLIQEESEVVIHDEFSLTGSAQPNTAIESRTIVQLLGEISAEGYGNFKSDFVCQFMPASKLVTDGVTKDDIDGLELILAYSKAGYIGDSIAPMGLEVFLLNKQLTSPIYSTLNPEEYYDVNSEPIASKIYVGNTQGESDSIQALSYKEIKIDLPKKIGQELYQLYLDNKEAYSFPTEFAKYFPGIYVRTSYGSGRVTQIQQTTMVMHYHTTTTDDEGNTVTTQHEGNYFAVTPEIITNNNISYKMDEALEARINAGENIVIAPVGQDIEIKFPIEDIINYYIDNSGLLSVVNTLSMTIPAEVIENNYNIKMPESLLMVLSTEKDKFFLDNSLNDDKTSFIATYSSTSGGYVVSGLRNYFLAMLETYKKGELTSADATFILTPVTLTTESSSNGYSTSTYVSAITPYIGKPAMAKLNLEKADITFQFSKQAFQ